MMEGGGVRRHRRKGLAMHCGQIDKNGKMEWASSRGHIFSEELDPILPHE